MTHPVSVSRQREYLLLHDEDGYVIEVIRVGAIDRATDMGGSTFLHLRDKTIAIPISVHDTYLLLTGS